MASTWIRIAIACAFFLPPLGLAGQTRTMTEYPGFDPRYGIAPQTDLAALIDKPTLVSLNVISFTDPASGERRLVGFGDAHGVFDVSLKFVSDALFDFVQQKSYNKEIKDVRLIEWTPTRAVVYQEIGVSFLGIKIGSKLVSEIYRDKLSATSAGVRSRMIENPSGNLYESYTSWYLQEVLIGGKKLLYIRAFSSPGLRNPVIGTDLAMKGFTPGNLKSQIEGNVSEARRRAAAH